MASQGSLTETNGAQDKPIVSLGKSAVLYRDLHHEPPCVVYASGNYLNLDTGETVFDATGGTAVACLGHGDERVKTRVVAQMDTVSYYHTFFFSSPIVEEFAKVFVNSTRGRMAKALVLSSGSEAMEAALKLARQYFLELPEPQPARVNFIARHGSYHGATIATLSLGGFLAKRAPYETMLPKSNFSKVSICHAYRGMLEGETREAYVHRLAKELDDEFHRIGPSTVSAFVAETVVGAAQGCVPAVEGYFAAVQAVCAKHGALLILDEVMCGMGRTGTLHAWEQEGIVPDIQSVGKALGGGYVPIAGVLLNHKVANVLHNGSGAFNHGQSFQGHPTACAAGLEVQNIVSDEGLVANVEEMGSLLFRSLREKLGHHANVGDIRGRGLFCGIEFVKDRRTKSPFDPRSRVAMRVHALGLRPPYNISLYPGSGTAGAGKGDHIIVSPSYRVSKDDVRLIVDRVAAVVIEFFDGFADFEVKEDY